MSMVDELMPYGIDLKDAMERFADSMPIYEKMLKKVPSSVEKYEVMSFFNAGDYATALANAHTMKGLTGNLSIIPLFKAYEQAVVQFRANQPLEAGETIKAILPMQAEIVAIINKYL